MYAYSETFSRCLPPTFSYLIIEQIYFLCAGGGGVHGGERDRSSQKNKLKNNGSKCQRNGAEGYGAASKHRVAKNRGGKFSGVSLDCYSPWADFDLPDPLIIPVREGPGVTDVRVTRTPHYSS